MGRAHLMILKGTGTWISPDADVCALTLEETTSHPNKRVVFQGHGTLAVQEHSPLGPRRVTECL